MPYNLPVILGKSIGAFALGMSRNEIWSQTKRPITSFYKTPDSKFRADDISLLGVHVHYEGDKELCSTIEAWTEVQYNKTLITIDGFVVNGTSMKDIKEWAFCMDVVLEQYGSGLESREHGIGFYSHDYGSDDSKVDGVYIMGAKSSHLG